MIIFKSWVFAIVKLKKIQKSQEDASIPPWACTEPFSSTVSRNYIPVGTWQDRQDMYLSDHGFSGKYQCMILFLQSSVPWWWQKTCKTSTISKYRPQLSLKSTIFRLRVNSMNGKHRKGKNIFALVTMLSTLWGCAYYLAQKSGTLLTNVFLLIYMMFIR